MKGLSRVLCLVVTILAGLNVAAQQITGNIRGTVTDSSGAVVQGAPVSARQAETGLVRTTATDKAGSYLLLELPVGHYELEVAAKGFQKYSQQGITLNVNETATIPVHVVVGAESEKVQVMSDAQMIQETVTSLGKVVQERLGHANVSITLDISSHCTANMQQEAAEKIDEALAAALAG